MNVDWMLSTQGRLARIVAGTLLILIGLGVIGGVFGVLLLIIGAVPIASAAYGTFLLGPLFGRDIYGRLPEDQPDEEEADEERDAEEADKEPASAREDSSSNGGAPEADPDWEPPPLARAERPEGQEPRTKDLRAED